VYRRRNRRLCTSSAVHTVQLDSTRLDRRADSDIELGGVNGALSGSVRCVQSARTCELPLTLCRIRILRRLRFSLFCRAHGRDQHTQTHGRHIQRNSTSVYYAPSTLFRLSDQNNKSPYGNDSDSPHIAVEHWPLNRIRQVASNMYPHLILGSLCRRESSSPRGRASRPVPPFLRSSRP